MDIACLLSEEPKKHRKGTNKSVAKLPENPVRILVDNLWAATVPPTSTAGKLRGSTSQNVLESLNIADFPFPRSLIADMCQRVLKSIDDRVNELAIQAEDGCKVIVQPIPIDWDAISTHLSCDKDECQTVWMELTRVWPKKTASTSCKTATTSSDKVGQKRSVPPTHKQNIQPDLKRLKPLNIDTSALRAVLTPNRGRVDQAPSLRDQLKVPKRSLAQSSLRSKLGEATTTTTTKPGPLSQPLSTATNTSPLSEDANTPAKPKQAKQGASCSEIQQMLLSSICAHEQVASRQSRAGAGSTSWQQGTVSTPTKLDSPEDLRALTSMLWVDDGGQLRQPDWLTHDDATLVLAVRSYGLDWPRLQEHVGNVSECELRMRWELLILRCRDRQRAQRDHQAAVWQTSPQHPTQPESFSFAAQRPISNHETPAFQALPSFLSSFSARQD